MILYEAVAGIWGNFIASTSRWTVPVLLCDGPVVLSHVFKAILVYPILSFFSFASAKYYYELLGKCHFQDI